MGLEQRQHIRFSIDIPAVRCGVHGEKFDVELRQISVGGCLINFDEGLRPGEEFRMLIQLPNGNWLPLFCKQIYEVKGGAMGIKFLDLTRFEQELVAGIISANLKQAGLPVQVDPFSQPPKPRTEDELKEVFSVREHAAAPFEG